MNRFLTLSAVLLTAISLGLTKNNGFLRCACTDG